MTLKRLLEIFEDAEGEGIVITDNKKLENFLETEVNLEREQSREELDEREIEIVDEE